jgi:hypothetical protein
MHEPTDGHEIDVRLSPLLPRVDADHPEPDRDSKRGFVVVLLGPQSPTARQVAVVQEMAWMLT